MHRRLVTWLVSGWAPTRRRHPWVLVIYLLAVAPAAALLVVIFTGGWGSRAFYGYMLLALFLGTIHEGVVHLYERRAESRS